MTDYYQILGVSETASPDEIKKAYRSLANKHHPDKGGDQARFKEISVAYDHLSDTQKKAEYDQQRMYGSGPEVRFGAEGFDPFGHMFGQGFPQGSPFGDIFSHMHRQQVRRNRDLNIHCNISFAESYVGKQLEANYRLPSGRDQNVVINVPAGVSSGDTIRYPGLGDDSALGAPRGNLNVTIIVDADPNYVRNGDDLYTTVNISPIEAMIGCRKSVITLTGQKLDLEIRAGVENGVEFASQGHGFPNVNTQRKGRFVSVVNIKTPVVTDPELVSMLKELDAKINKK